MEVTIFSLGDRKFSLGDSIAIYGRSMAELRTHLINSANVLLKNHVLVQNKIVKLRNLQIISIFVL